MGGATEAGRAFRDRRLNPERVVAAVSGLLQTKLALTGPETRIVELALCGDVHDLLAQSGWLVRDEFSFDPCDKGAKYKRCDLITFRTYNSSGQPREPKPKGITHAYEIKVLNNSKRATDGFQKALLLDAARLALFGQQYENCCPVQLVVAGVGALAAYAQDQKNEIETRLERWAPLWGAMRTVASADGWYSLARDRGYSKVKTGARRVDFETQLDTFRGLFSSNYSPRSAQIVASNLLEGTPNDSSSSELADYVSALGGKSIKYDQGSVHLVQCPGREERPDNVGPDDYLVFATRVRAV